MRQVLYGHRGVELAHVPRPLLQDGHVLVKVAYSLISSGTESRSVAGAQEQLLRRAVEQPSALGKLARYLRDEGLTKTLCLVKEKLTSLNPLGYSCAGTVLQAAGDVAEFAPGDAVACGGGGVANHAEVVLVPRNLMVRVPAATLLRDAASVAIGAIALQGVRRADAHLGEYVAVLGLGLLGQITVQLLAASGCRVIALDIDARRVQLAKRMGAEWALLTVEAGWRETLAAATAGRGVDVVLLTASSEGHGVLQTTMEIARNKGRVVVVGDVGLHLQRHPFYEKELDLLISCSYGPGRYDATYETRGAEYPYAYVRWTENRNMAEYLRLIGARAVRLEGILEEEFDIARLKDAYGQLLSQEGAKPIGILLRYESAEGQPGSDQVVRIGRKAALAKLRIGVVGAGAFARSVHLPNIAANGRLFAVRAIASRTGASASNLAKLYGADYATTDANEIFADPDIDAVIICTRHNQHAQQVVAALSAGKHVYVEKPLCMTRADSIVLHEFLAARASKAQDDGSLPLLMVGYNRRYSPYVEKLKAALQTRVGPFLAVYRVNAGHLPADHWVHGPEGGGRLIGEACHMIDLLYFLAGSDCEEISAEPLPVAPGKSAAVDSFTLRLRFADGSVGILVYTSHGGAALSKEYLEIHFDNQSLVLDDFRRLTRHFASGAAEILKSKQDKGHRRALIAFGEYLVLGTGLPPMTWKDALAAADITLYAAAALNGDTPLSQGQI